MKALCVFQEMEEKTFKEQYKSSINGLLSKPHQVFQYYTQKNFSLGFVQTVKSESVDKVVFRSENKTIVLLGYPISLNSDINVLLHKAIQYETKSIISLLSSQLDGAFSVIVIEDNTSDIYVITDPLGYYPVYINEYDNQSIIISTEIKGISKLFEKATLSIKGFVSWARSGSTYGSQTLVEGVKRLHGGSVYNIRLNRKSYSYQSYWSQSRHKSEYFDLELLDELFKSFTEEVNCYSSLSDNTQLTLSGGFDSRLIAGVLKKLNKSIHTVSIDHFDEAGNLDGYLASKIAKELSFSHESIRQDQNFYSFNRYIDFMVDSELSVPSDAIFIASITRAFSESFNGIWDGLGPGNAFQTTSVQWRNFDDYIQNGVTGKLEYNINELKNFFNAEVSDYLYESWNNFIPELLTKFRNDIYGVLDFIENGRKRHRISMIPLKVASNYSIPLTPGIGKNFRNLVGSIPINLITSEKMHSAILNNYLLNLSRYPVISGGKVFYLNTPFGITYLQTKVRENLLTNWRLRSLLKQTLKPKVRDSYKKEIYTNNESIDKAIQCFGLNENIINEKKSNKLPNSELLMKLSLAFTKSF